MNPQLPNHVAKNPPQYPGSLSTKDIEQCRHFIQELQKIFPTRPAVAEQVFGAFRRVEDPPYTVCRFLRAYKFSYKAALSKLLDEKRETLWIDARKHDFFPDLPKALGTSASLFLSQYPFIHIGRSKCGYPVNYFQPGQVQPEGLLAQSTLPRAERNFWNQFIYQFQKDIMSSMIDNDDHAMMCEGINVVDIGGASRSVFSSDFLNMMKAADNVVALFPETLHSIVVLNAPVYAVAFWRFARNFMDSSAATRLHMYSSKEKGLNHMRNLIDDSQIPSDYGGTNVSFGDAMKRETAKHMNEGAGGAKFCRQDVTLLSIAKRGGTEKINLVLEEGEHAMMIVHTRSASSANFGQ